MKTLIIPASTFYNYIKSPGKRIGTLSPELKYNKIYYLYILYIFIIYSLCIIPNSMAYETRKCNATFPRALQRSLSWTELIPFLILTPNSFISLLTFSFHLDLEFPTSLFPIGLPIKILKVLLPSLRLTTCPAYLVDFINLITFGEQYKLWISSL